jgi:hypothetical protein
MYRKYLSIFMALFEFVLASVNLQRFKQKKKRRIRGTFSALVGYAGECSKF